MKFYCVSQSGFQNFGDELILRTWLTAIREKHPGVPIVVDSASPGLTSYLLQDFDDVVVVDFWWRLSRLMASERIYSLDTLRQKWDFLRTVDLSFPGITHVHFLGGGYVNNLYPSNFLLAHIASEYKRKFRFKLYATGWGMMPVERNAGDPQFRHFMTALKSFDRIDVRDQESLDFLAPVIDDRAAFTCDDLFLAPAGRYAVVKREKRRKGRLVYIVHGKTQFDSSLVDFCYRLANFHQNTKNGVQFLIFSEEDLEMANAIIAAIGPKVKSTIHHFADLYRKPFQLHSDDYVFSTRFHGHLLCSASGVRGMVASIDPKYYDAKHRSLHRLGSGYKFVGLHDHVFTDADLEFPAWNGGLAERYAVLHEAKRSVFDGIY